MIYLHLFWAFFKIGALGFGGGMAIIQMISDSIQQFTAISAEEFANIVAIAQVTPGPVAINTATYVGYEVAGIPGAAIATIGVATPAFIIISLICRLIGKHRQNRQLQGALEGIRPATVGMIASAAITVGVPAFVSQSHLGSNFARLAGALPAGVDVISIAICLATIILIGKFKVDPFKVLIAMAVVGAVLGA